VRPGKEQGLSLTGPDRLLMQVIHDPGDQVNKEMTEHVSKLSTAATTR
jgi:hypothetical protein